MFDFFKALRGILKRRNKLIREQKQRAEAAECANRILTAYIAVLVGDKGTLLIPKIRVSSVLGKFYSEVASDGENYVITIKEDRRDVLGKREARG